MKNSSKILVTGIHRSGSSWTGGILASAQKSRYVREPFNIATYPKSPFKYWFEYLPCTLQAQDSVINYLDSFNSCLGPHIKNKIKRKFTFSNTYNLLADIRSTIICKNLILKDPIAVLSSEWLHTQYNCNVLIVIRHPAAFIAGIKRLGWRHDFNHFLKQKEFIEKHPSYSQKINQYAQDTNLKYNIIDHGILLWNIIYSAVIDWQMKYQNTWIFVRHEDLCKDPTNNFNSIFKKFGLYKTEKTSKMINKTVSNPPNTKKWKTELSPDEISKIKNSTQKVWKNFYLNEDW